MIQLIFYVENDLENQKSLHNFGKRYNVNFRVIFYHWPKLYFVLNVEAEI